jgi:hypothetical protein
MAGNREKSSHEKKKMGPEDQDHDCPARAQRQTTGRDLSGTSNPSQTQYYQWPDQFLANAHQVFNDNENQNERLSREHAHQRKIIGDLTVELKKPKSVLLGLAKEAK